jgi:hypothetical protein
MRKVLLKCYVLLLMLLAGNHSAALCLMLVLFWHLSSFCQMVAIT